MRAEYLNAIIIELLDKDVSENRMNSIRKEVIDVVFSYGKGTTFEQLVDWNDDVLERIAANKNNLELPYNKENILSILDLIQQLDFQNK